MTGADDRGSPGGHVPDPAAGAGGAPGRAEVAAGGAGTGGTAATSRWRERFTAPGIGGVTWPAHDGTRLAVVSSEGGIRGAWAYDLASGTRRRVSRPDAGAEEAIALPDGTGAVWWLDPSGDERGRWMVSPFDDGDDRPLFPGIADAWAWGLSLVPGRAAAAFATDEDHVVVVADTGGAVRVLSRHPHPVGVGREWPQGTGGLSADGRLLCLRDAGPTDIAHPALRVVDAGTGAAVAEVLDAGRVVEPIAWSPVAGDGRLVITREVGDRRRPWMWKPGAGSLVELAVDLPGDVGSAWWYPDGTAILLHHELRGEPSLHRLDLDSGACTTVVARGGTIEDAGVRPDGEVWYRYEDGATPPAWLAAVPDRLVTAAVDPVRVAPPAPPAPAGRRWDAVDIPGLDGDLVRAWVLRPDGEPPFPTIVHAHGGPEWHLSDRWDPLALALADAGFLGVAPDYHGSTGYGAAFRERLVGDPGFPEVADLVAVLRHVVAAGLADPARAILEGWSWGGYLATLGAGLHPDRWRAVVAGIPVGDLVAAHYESAPLLQAWDAAVFGGDPMEVPALYHERNPMTYVDRVTAPVLILAGERDSRCPLGQAMVYAHALRRRGHPLEVHLYAEGHHALRDEERVLQAEVILDFLARSLAPA